MTKLRKTNSSLHINNARIAGLYDLEHTIGKGHFAVVKLARHVFTGEKVAAKVIDKTRLDPVSTSHMMQEVRCMKLVQHPNVVRLYEVIDTQTKLFLILELGDYDMYEWVMRRGYDKGGCKESDAQLYFSQIIQAINYCHKLHVVHRDLKPENVVFFERLGMVKLTDFGFSNLFTPGQQLQTSCGSLAYSAPEILLGDCYDAPAVDVWSLGVILYMLVCGRLPFQESNDSETLTRILDCKFSFPEHVSVECKNLVSSMLVRDPSKRASLSEICQNKWVRAGDRGHAEALPLIVKDNLPLCAHTTIIEQMVAGQIGTEEEIVRKGAYKYYFLMPSITHFYIPLKNFRFVKLIAIERNDYNHLTATYYLLAERVLYCYRQAEANRLMAAAAREFSSVDENSPDDINQNSTIPGTSTASSTRSRSRSNSWRGPAPRRAYSILKEESEELSSYLKSSSRQSSRFYNIPSSGAKSSRENASSRASYIAMSRANSNDSFAPVAPIHENNRDQSPDIVIQRLRHKNSNGQSIFDGQSDEEIGGSGGSASFYLPRQTRQRTTSSHSVGGRIMSGSSSNQQQQLPPLPNSPEHQNVGGGSKFRIGSVGSRNSFTSSFVGGGNNRNSSPSVALLRTTSLTSSRDRISPHAIQELLELSRLSGRMRRTASPDGASSSLLSSRSASPSCMSSGRVSPLYSSSPGGGLVMRILKSGTPSGSLLSSGGGMRKLSSSPHLLGICEEIEECDFSLEPTQNTCDGVDGLDPDCLTSGRRSVTSIDQPFWKNPPLISRSARSASMGLTSMGRLSLGGGTNKKIVANLTKATNQTS
uniref:SNF-related serine/threonine-protein kinase n=1 Tax=Meloidogyne javanica TaxID=6303 RepID=A0A915LGK4_MELJA